MERKRKGQAALEFLMTYGWAILAAIIVIGVLGYFFLSTNKLTPTSVVVSAPLYAKGAAISAAGISVEIQNSDIEEIRVVSGSTITITSPSDIDCTSTTGVTIQQGKLGTVAFTCSPVLVAGNTIRGSIAITYEKGSGTLDLTSTGPINGGVAA